MHKKLEFFRKRLNNRDTNPNFHQEDISLCGILTATRKNLRQSMEIRTFLGNFCAFSSIFGAIIRTPQHLYVVIRHSGAAGI